MGAFGLGNELVLFIFARGNCLGLGGDCPIYAISSAHILIKHSRATSFKVTFTRPALKYS